MNGRVCVPVAYRAFSAFLIFLIILQSPGLLYAKTPEHIAVVELHHRGTRPDTTRKMTDRFREELSRYKNLKVLSREESRAILDYHNSFILESGEVSPIRSVVASAKQAYFAFDLNRAAKICEQAIQQSLAKGPLDRDYRSLLEAYTIQGIIAMAEYRKADAKESFRQLVFHNPDVTLDKRYFAPSVIKKIKRAKKELKEQSLGALSIKAKPAAADVYVNGVYRGAAPLQLEGYPEGAHVITVKAANYITKSRLVKVKPDKTAHASLTLAWQGKNNAFPIDMVGFHRDQFDNLEQLTSAAAMAAQAMRVRKLILVEVKREKGDDVVTAHVVDQNLQTFHRPQSVAAQNIKNESAQVSATLATQVLDEMNQKIMKNPPHLAAAPYYGDVVLIGRKRRSLLKSPWFWVAIGAVVAGGVTAGILATRGTQTVGAIDVIFR